MTYDCRDCRASQSLVSVHLLSQHTLAAVAVPRLTPWGVQVHLQSHNFTSLCELHTVHHAAPAQILTTTLCVLPCVCCPVCCHVPFFPTETGTMSGGGGRPRGGLMKLGNAAPRVAAADAQAAAKELAAAEKVLQQAEEELRQARSSRCGPAGCRHDIRVCCRVEGWNVWLLLLQHTLLDSGARQLFAASL